MPRRRRSLARAKRRTWISLLSLVLCPQASVLDLADQAGRFNMVKETHHFGSELRRRDCFRLPGVVVLPDDVPGRHVGRDGGDAVLKGHALADRDRVDLLEREIGLDRHRERLRALRLVGELARELPVPQ